MLPLGVVADDPIEGPALQAVRTAADENVDPRSEAVHALAPGSPLMTQLEHTPVPV